ncbi:MAG TPA: polysaccharide biosynthesis/export family protein [Candidatus Acidoferrales bacterium]|nr:polysaccharide biosynthesis/export family protein [Candidatus Acidoferrales bacterium]
MLLTFAAILACSATGSFAFGSELPGQQQSTRPAEEVTTQNYNLRLQQLASQKGTLAKTASDYLIGPNDLLEISVYNAPDLDRTVRVSAKGTISLPLIGDVEAFGSTVEELESRIEGLLRQTFMTDPEVNVFVKEIQSHPVSVFGAVGRPGVYQLQEPESLIQVLSLAQGLADDAGDKVIIMRRNGTAEDDSLELTANHEPFGPAQHAPKSLQVDLKELLTSAGSASNVEVYPGDVVKVPPAGIVYVVGQVHKPGGFLLRTNENISVLQALALAEGTTSTSSQKGARIIRTEAGGEKQEIRIDLKRILEGKAADPVLQSKDILFIPNSAGKSAFYRGAEAALSITGGLIVYRR